MDETAIEYTAYVADKLITYTGDAESCKRFVSVALYDPKAKNYRS